MSILVYKDFSLAASRPILDGISLTLRGPGVVAMLGPSGVGKSTLLRATQRLLEYGASGWSRQGDILLDGQSIFTVDPRVLARRIGFIHQKPCMLHGSVADNVAFALRHGTRMSKASIAATVQRSLERVGLTGEVSADEPAWRLSGGQAQRLAIARAIALEPEILLMDEPSSALDPLKSRRVEQIIADLARERLVVVVTHDVPFAERVADWIAFLDAGPNGARLVTHGVTDQVLYHDGEAALKRFIAPSLGDMLEPEPAGEQVAQVFLFVCGGNTSRSPLAQMICGQAMAGELGLSGRKIEVLSGGLSPKVGRPLSATAAGALTRLGYDAAPHHSREIDAETVARADQIYCMTSKQRRQVIERFPHVRHKVALLDPISDIPNPHDQPQERVLAIATRIRDAVLWRLGDLQKAKTRRSAMLET